MPFKFNPLTGQFDLVNAAGGGGAAISGGTNSQSTGTVNFSNSNGVSFGLDTNGVMTATVQTNYLTTAMASNRGSDFVQATAAFAGTSASGTIASNGISISIGPYLTTAMASNRGSDFVQANAAFAGTSASGTIASDGISVSIGPYITTGALSNHSHGVSFTSGSVGFQTLSFTNSNGFSFNSSTQGIFGSYTVPSVTEFLTTAALSNHSHGNPTLALTNLTGTTASASNGFTLSLSAAAPGAGGGFAAQGSGAYTQNTGTIQWANSNGITFGLSTNQMTASHNGLTTAALSNHSHAASASNGSFDFQTLNFSNANNVTFGTSAGGIITASVAAGAAGPVRSYYQWPDGPVQGTSAWTVGQSTSYFQPVYLPYDISVSYIRLPLTLSCVGSLASLATTANQTYGLTISSTFNYGFYTQNVGANSRSLASYATGSASWQQRASLGAGAVGSNWSSGHTISFPREGGNTDFTSSAATTLTNRTINSSQLSNFTNVRFLDLPFATSLAAGPYWFMYGSSTSMSTSGTANMSTLRILASNFAITQVANTGHNLLGSATNSSNHFRVGLGSWSTNSAGTTTASIGLASISSSAAFPVLHFQMIRQA